MCGNSIKLRSRFGLSVEFRHRGISCDGRLNFKVGVCVMFRDRSFWGGSGDASDMAVWREEDRQGRTQARHAEIFRSGEINYDQESTYRIALRAKRGFLYNIGAGSRRGASMSSPILPNDVFDERAILYFPTGGWAGVCGAGGPGVGALR